MAGSPSYRDTLAVQRANLVRFVADNAAAFATMPYEPWTSVPTGALSVAQSVEVRRSRVAPGILGVYLCQPTRTNT